MSRNAALRVARFVSDMAGSGMDSAGDVIEVDNTSTIEPTHPYAQPKNPAKSGAT